MKQKEIFYMATLKEYFDTDLTHVLNANNIFRFSSDNSTIEVNARLHLDFNSNTNYISLYIPECSHPLNAVVGILNSLEMFLGISDGVGINFNLPGEKSMNSNDLQFSGRIFIYSESPIPEMEFEKICEQAYANGIYLQYRGQEFAKQRSALEKPMAFISHDSRDKDDVARPIAVKLASMMCSVWFDEFSLKVGDRLRESIEKGIRECEKCILILSPNFLSNPGWTKTEFNSVFTREIIEGTDFLLPVWYRVNKQEVFDYSPTLLDRLGVSWDLGENEVTRRLYNAIVKK